MTLTTTAHARGNQAGKAGLIIFLLLLLLLPGPVRATDHAAGSPASAAAPGRPEDTAFQAPAFPAPGADALNLKITKRYALARDGSVRHRLYVRRRILTYKGKKEYADFKYTYNRFYQEVRLIKARTFKADGSILKVGDQEVHDIPAPWNSEASLYSRARQLVVNLPAVEPGCEIEVELEVTSRFGFWCSEYFRFSDPILDKEVVIEAPADIKLKFIPPTRLQLKHETRKTADGRVAYRWHGHRIPGLTPVRWAPNPAEQGYCLMASSFPDNAAVAAFFRQRFPGLDRNDDKTTHPAPGQKNRQAAGTPPASFKIFQELSRKTTPFEISFQETDMRVQNPALTAKNGYGRDADLALLFYHKLRQKHLPARLLMTCESGRFPETFGTFPWPGWWDATLVESDGCFFYFGGDKPAPGITGFDGCPALDLASGRLITIRDREPSSVATRIELFPGRLPAASGRFKITIKGDAATGWRRRWRNLAPGEKNIAASQMLHELNPTAVYTAGIKIDGLDNNLKPLVFTGSFTIDRLFAGIGRNLFLLPLPAPDFPLPWPTLLHNRKQPLAVTGPDEFHNLVLLHLGRGLKPLRLPPEIRGETGGFSWQAKVVRNPRDKTLTFTRSYRQKRGIFKTSPTAPYRRFLTGVRDLAGNENLGIILEQETPNQ